MLTAIRASVSCAGRLWERKMSPTTLLNLKQCCPDVRAFEIRILASSIEKQFVLDAFMQI